MKIKEEDLHSLTLECKIHSGNGRYLSFIELHHLFSFSQCRTYIDVVRTFWSLAVRGALSTCVVCVYLPIAIAIAIVGDET